MKISETQNISFKAKLQPKFLDFAQEKMNASKFHYGTQSKQLQEFTNTLKKIQHFKPNDSVDIEESAKHGEKVIVEVTRGRKLPNSSEHISWKTPITNDDNFFKSVLKILVGNETNTELSNSQLKKIKSPLS